MGALDTLLGKPLASWEKEEQKIGVVGGVPTLGLDGLASASYGPEAALTILIPLGAAGLIYIGPIVLCILALLALLYISYRQTIAAYPNGGGSYIVASENLGRSAGLLAAAALLLDYVLNVAVAISAGIGALVSAVPQLHPYMLSLCLITLALITMVNLRGVRESAIAFGVPTYIFIVSLVSVLVFGAAKTVLSGGHPQPAVPPPAPAPAVLGTAILWLLMRSFSSGCTAMTGVEAVSNGIRIFRKPVVRNAQRTLTVIVAVLGFLLAGIAYLSYSYSVVAMDQTEPGYQSVISQLVGAIVGRGYIYYVTMGSVLAVLALSANTSFADFPRLCRLLANDSFLPHAFAQLGRRLVYSLGITSLALLSGLLLVAFGGITDRLIPLFAVGAFGAFTLSQAGMVMHWRRVGGRHAGKSKLINGVGAIATAAALCVLLFTKFMEGAWITVILLPAIILLFTRIRRHYDNVAREITRPLPLDLRNNEPPVVLLPIQGWNAITAKALRFALRLSREVFALHITFDENEGERLREEWAEKVERSSRNWSVPPPRLQIVLSPYRDILTPLEEFITRLEEQFPNRLIAVIIPELVERHWFDFLMHDHSATWLKAHLLFRGDRRVVVANVPWYSGPEWESEEEKQVADIEAETRASAI